MPYTVILLWEETEEVAAHHVEAPGPFEALEAVCAPGALIIGVIRGHHEMFTLPVLVTA